MRSPRIVLLLACFTFATVLLTFSSLRHSYLEQGDPFARPRSPKSDIRSFFSITNPASLFPPSAIISLTDDNSTFFLAKLAGFGPYLPSEGLSGRLWVGSGFGDDSLIAGGATSRAEGELGCSDIPGWVDGRSEYDNDKDGMQRKAKSLGTRPMKESSEFQALDGLQRKGLDPGDVQLHPRTEKDAVPHGSDGTDDHLHYPLRASKLASARKLGQHGSHDMATSAHRSEHADIQSLQESAEIQGKVVLLSRGGCGFLEKVKWSQRRGGIAVIVGDNTRGEPLVTMWAHGDTSNVSIPALFTSYTTAHLLSSLIPPSSLMDDSATRDGPGLPMSNARVTQRIKSMVDGPTFTQANSIIRPTGLAKPTGISTSSSRSLRGRDSTDNPPNKPYWGRSLSSILGFGSKRDLAETSGDSRRPPSSGRLDWVISDDWNDDTPVAEEKKGLSKSNSKAGSNQKAKLESSSPHDPKDGFIIGVQDWRDPDLVPSGDPKAAAKETPNPGIASGVKSGKPNHGNLLAGGSITPGSGEYANQPSKGDSGTTGEAGSGSRGGWVNSLWASHEDDVPHDIEEETHPMSKAKLLLPISENLDADGNPDSNPPSEHEGLWVTMTATKMSASPFFDTILVLVVSPLVTLTMVYALLLIRARIRRRRWRAPKAVVDRLPVRTYRTISSSSDSVEATSPFNSTAASPLLASTLSRTRPRSRTTSGISENIAATLDKATAIISRKREDRHASSYGSKKRYNGKQVECVVCLEEYVDGQSRVMKLPCGHEFHAECITPWLTTRRRTCPICKGDVVRSMANGSPFSSGSLTPIRSYHTINNGDNDEDQAFGSSNESASSAIPIPRSSDHNGDSERGEDLAATLVNDGPESSLQRRGWRELAAMSLSAFSGEAAWRHADSDRNR